MEESGAGNNDVNDERYLFVYFFVGTLKWTVDRIQN